MSALSSKLLAGASPLALTLSQSPGGLLGDWALVRVLPAQKLLQRYYGTIFTKDFGVTYFDRPTASTKIASMPYSCWDRLSPETRMAMQKDADPDYEPI